MTEEDGAKSMHEWEGKKRADMLARFDRILPEARAELQEASDADMADRWKMFPVPTGRQPTRRPANFGNPAQQRVARKRPAANRSH